MWRTSNRRALSAALALSLLVPVVALAAPASGSSVANPEVTGPIPASQGVFGRPQTDSRFSLEPYGYVEEEYFLSGTAKTYGDAPTTAPYTTRMVVRRPADRRRFNGTTIVEWNNVTAQFDNTPDWVWAHEMIMRRGFAYAHVSAQSAGHCCSPLSLKVVDPTRYAALSHPGDDFSFDMFSQAVQAIRSPVGVDPMGGLRTRRVLAAGHSQSAGRLHDYVIDVQAGAGVIDGFHIDGGGEKTFPAEPAVPVMHVLEEVGMSPGEPNVSENYRLWEVAGAAHADYWVLRHEFDAPDHVLVPGHEPYEEGWDEREHEVAGNYGYDIEPRQFTCAVGGNMFPKRYAVSAALVRLDQWVRTGRAAPQPPRVEFTTQGAVVTDVHGNTVGGLRLPPIDVPVARYVGQSCGLFGNTIPFDPATLQSLYPTHEDYVAKMRVATRRAVAAGVLLPEDALDLMGRAEGSSIPAQGVQSPLPPHLTQ